jgi:signal recognition particle subunit SRP72
MYMQWIFKCSGIKPKKKGICNHFGHCAYRFRWVLQEAAAFKLGQNKMKAAASMFEQLVSSSSTMVKMETLNGLVCSTTFSKPIKARSYEKQIPPLPGLLALNAETLERTAPTKCGRVGEDRVEATKIGDGKLDKVRPARKRKRKPLYCSCQSWAPTRPREMVRK